MLDMGFIHGHPQDHRPAAGRAPDPAVLCHVLGGHPSAGRRFPARSGRPSRSRRSNAAAELVRQVCHPGRPRTKARAAQPADPIGAHRAGPGLHADQARRQPPGRAAVRDGISAAAIHGNKSQSQRVRALAEFKRGSVAILVATDIAAVASTSTRFPTWSTSSCRWCRRTTSTASGGQDAPAWMATRSRSCASMSFHWWPPSSASSVTRSNARRCPASSPTPGSGRSPSGSGQGRPAFEATRHGVAADRARAEHRDPAADSDPLLGMNRCLGSDPAADSDRWPDHGPARAVREWRGCHTGRPGPTRAGGLTPRSGNARHVIGLPCPGSASPATARRRSAVAPRVSRPRRRSDGGRARRQGLDVCAGRSGSRPGCRWRALQGCAGPAWQSMAAATGPRSRRRWGG